MYHQRLTRILSRTYTPTCHQAALARAESGLWVPAFLCLPVADRGRFVARFEEFWDAGAGVWVMRVNGMGGIGIA